MPTHNESQAEFHGPSRKQKIIGNLVVGGAFVLPLVLTGAGIYFGMKSTKMQLDAAKLNLESARLAVK